MMVRVRISITAMAYIQHAIDMISMPVSMPISMLLGFLLFQNSFTNSTQALQTVSAASIRTEVKKIALNGMLLVFVLLLTS
jgi:hypothetical protein